MTVSSRHALAALAAAAVFGLYSAALITSAGSTPLAAFQKVASISAGQDDEAPFLAENDAAMTTMMNGMAVKPTGHIDRDFVEMMIPHHQGAIDMAEAELRYGKNEQLRRIAQEIIVDQLQEIVAMRVALGDPLPPQIAAPTHPTISQAPADEGTSPPSGSMMQMSPNMKMK